MAISMSIMETTKVGDSVKKYTITLAALCMLALPTFAQAATHKTSSSSAPTATSSGIGNDVSYPQCGTSLPNGQAFGIVGVNDGLASNFNPCLGAEYNWAQASKVTTKQVPAQLYVNTGNPGAVVVQYQVTDWPSGYQVPNSTISTNDPYQSVNGGCYQVGTVIDPTTNQLYPYGPDNQACAWQYGFNKAYADYQQVAATDYQTNTPIPAQSVPWWFDVETSNSWDSGTAGQQNNVATLEGMQAALKQLNVSDQLGAYSTNAQWSQIFGTQITSTSPLRSLINWQAGARNEKAAVTACSNAKFAGTEGVITLTQYTTTIDSDYSCIH
jgi:hypothetical protein